ncbi:MAG: triose-phosphate isomerase, partial [Gemmatimonadaceae bacterium]
GARVILVGHSERRHVFGETDDECAKKCLAASRAGVSFMLCVGETIEQRQAGETETLVRRQLRGGLAEVNPTTADFLLAYEPVWAIGTGLTASAADASAIHKVLRTKCNKKKWGVGCRVLGTGCEVKAAFPRAQHPVPGT